MNVSMYMVSNDCLVGLVEAEHEILVSIPKSGEMLPSFFDQESQNNNPKSCETVMENS